MFTGALFGGVAVTEEEQSAEPRRREGPSDALRARSEVERERRACLAVASRVVVSISRAPSLPKRRATTNAATLAPTRAAEAAKRSRSKRASAGGVGRREST